MRRVRLALSTLALAAACHTSAGALREPAYATLASNDGTPTSAHPSELHDDVAAALGIPPLRAVALPPETREIRMSTGPGMISGVEYAVVRIVQDSAAVRGEVWRYRWQRDSAGTGRYVVRRVAPNPQPNWRHLISRLDALGADTLVVAPESYSRSDGGALLFESRRGTNYRSVYVGAPRYRSGDAARRAAAIETLIDSLDHATAR